MGWSKWSRQFLFLQLLILLPLGLESDLLQVAKDSSDHCLTGDKATCKVTGLNINRCSNWHSDTTTTIISESRAISKDSDDEKVLAELRARIKMELITDFRAAIQSALQHWGNMVDYSPASPKQETKKQDEVEEYYCKKPSEEYGHEGNNCIKESSPAVVKDNLSPSTKRKRDNGYTNSGNDDEKSKKRKKNSGYNEQSRKSEKNNIYLDRS